METLQEVCIQSLDFYVSTKHYTISKINETNDAILNIYI